MRIRLAILEKDRNFLNRIAAAFSARYSDRLEIYSFTDEEMAMDTLQSSKIDVLLASDMFDIDMAKVPENCGFAYLVESKDLEKVNGQCAICKFQKVDLIHKQILNVYSELAGNKSGAKVSDDGTKVVIFSSPCGGTGTSTIAASCAQYYSKKGYRTLFLELEKFGSSDIFFSSEGQFDMSDIIYALKSKKTNLAIKLESCVKQDVSGVFFYSKTKVALDMLELKDEDVLTLINEIRNNGSYDYIIVDMEFSVSKDVLDIYKVADSVVWVSDGSFISNEKIKRTYESLEIMESTTDVGLIRKLLLIYNKFSDATCKVMDDIAIKNIGGVMRYKCNSVSQLVNELSTKAMFDEVI